jgi:hypothetical protein
MYLDVDSSLGDVKMANAVSNLSEFAAVQILGSYSRHFDIERPSLSGLVGI